MTVKEDRYYQLETTTRCNFACFYRAGRDMPQEDMAWETFQHIVDSIKHENCTVSLQGEGEPSLHPRFMAMARYVLSKGHIPYSILNASRVDAEELSAVFPRLGFSVDTLDPDRAERIGRYSLPKVLRNIDSLCERMAPQRITIMTVDMGQPSDELKTWVRQRGFGRHIVQPLSPKSDYARRYTVNTEAIMPRQASICKYLERNLTHFYRWDGEELPCCFMKDSTGFTSVAELRGVLASSLPVMSCQGCVQLQPIGSNTRNSKLVS